MGQTLTHGIYLPDEGERNCYDGLASNWSILDGAVGTVAEHTTALSGKAPAVHTHGKADITDLFNSANTWTGDNTYSKTVAIERSTDTGNFLALKNTIAELGSTPTSATPVTIAYRDKNDENLGYMGVYYDTDGSNHFRLYVRNKYTSGVPSTSGSPDYAFFGLRLNADKSKEGILKASFRPYDNNAHDLGTSSYKWKTLNGINPGALSLPDMSATGVDISGSIVPPSGETTINISGGTNTYTATINGWLCIAKASSACRYIKTTVNSRLGQTTIVSGSSISGSIYHCQPVPAGKTVSILLDADSQAGYYFYPCLGNV